MQSTGVSGPVLDGEELPVFIARDSHSASGALPADYDGWLQYAAVNISKLGLSGSFSGFTNVMSVPMYPEKELRCSTPFPVYKISTGYQNTIPSLSKASTSFSLFYSTLEVSFQAAGK